MAGAFSIHFEPSQVHFFCPKTRIATGISAVMSLVGVIVAVIAIGKLLVAHWDEIKAVRI